ncbi:hypothetical protein Pan189_35440 [Stratiformator vulcanicus]|uniref:Uncharacterized protein n=2 Tax=Stratiformator vulcanicus TaxID=2527980 RepID=A0A517R5H6_9PLAN|nr:hypothetical protein Pan189_35440 [Stratiformator vulcanicus]
MARTYGFILTLRGVDTSSPAFVDAVFEAGGDDASVGGGFRREEVAFDRDAESFDEAVRSAIACLRTAAPTTEVIGIEVDDPADLAQLLPA